MPVPMDKPQAVVMGEKIYVGGGTTENVEDRYQVFQYDPSRDEWSSLPLHQVRFFDNKQQQKGASLQAISNEGWVYDKLCVQQGAPKCSCLIPRTV